MDLALPSLSEPAPRSATDLGRPALGSEAAEGFAFVLQMIVPIMVAEGGVSGADLALTLPAVPATAPPAAEQSALADGIEAASPVSDAPAPHGDAGRDKPEEGEKAGDPAQAFFGLRLVPDMGTASILAGAPQPGPPAPPPLGDEVKLHAPSEVPPPQNPEGSMPSLPLMAAAAPGTERAPPVSSAIPFGGSGQAERIAEPFAGPLFAAWGEDGAAAADGLPPPAVLPAPGNRSMVAPRAAPLPAAETGPPEPDGAEGLLRMAPHGGGDAKPTIAAVPLSSPPTGGVPSGGAGFPPLPEAPTVAIASQGMHSTPAPKLEALNTIDRAAPAISTNERDERRRETVGERRAEGPGPVELRRMPFTASTGIASPAPPIGRGAAAPEGHWVLQEAAPREPSGGPGHVLLSGAALEVRPTIATDLPRAHASPPLHHQIAVAIRETGAHALEIRLEPEELGLLRISLRPEGEHLRVHLQAERGETLELLRRSAGELAQALQDAGHGNTSFSFQRWGAQPEARPTRPPEEEPLARQGPELAAAPPRRGTGGRLDLRL